MGIELKNLAKNNDRLDQSRRNDRPDNFRVFLSFSTSVSALAVRTQDA